MARKTDPKNFERVLDAAASLFLEVGYDAASMQKLAERLGLHKSSLYHYVDGKEDLLEHLIDEAQSNAESDLETAERDLENGYLTAVRLAIEQTLNDRGRVSLVLRQRPGTATGDGVIARRRAYDQRLAKLIERDQKSGAIRNDIHPTLLARLTLGLVAWVVEWYDPKLTRFSADEICSAALALVSHGVILPDSDPLNLR
ncbi:MAG: TetR/AcrR family transcriptional regulator [Gammaproteobacteria bacterium]|nr:TetR/AcrR family transcriptional regulator [Gammaproteobacteria bacterium]